MKSVYLININSLYWPTVKNSKLFKHRDAFEMDATRFVLQIYFWAQWKIWFSYFSLYIKI